MDPLTAFAQLATALVQLAQVVIESQPPEVRARLWELHLRDVEAWRAIFGRRE